MATLPPWPWLPHARHGQSTPPAIEVDRISFADTVSQLSARPCFLPSSPPFTVIQSLATLRITQPTQFLERSHVTKKNSAYSVHNTNDPLRPWPWTPSP